MEYDFIICFMSRDYNTIIKYKLILVTKNS